MGAGRRVAAGVAAAAGIVAVALLAAMAGLEIPAPPPQPVPFSHAHHAGEVGIDCRYCHYFVERASSAGFPAMEVCASCHYPVPERPGAEPVVWRRLTKLPEFVYFDHSIHLGAGVGCATCHGAVERMARVRQPQPFTMLWCLDCHRDPTPYLRERADLFETDWRAPEDHAESGRRLMAERGIDPARLEHCYVCHR